MNSDGGTPLAEESDAEKNGAWRSLTHFQVITQIQLWPALRPGGEWAKALRQSDCYDHHHHPL